MLCGAMVGAGLGFLWFNSYPAQVFMGDVGSLSLGGALGTIAVITKQEIVLVIVGGIFVMEALVGHLPGDLLRLLRQADLPHGADPSSFRTERVAGAEDHRPLLDHQHHSGAGGHVDTETALKQFEGSMFICSIVGPQNRTTGYSFMELKSKKILAVGLARTGVAVARFLAERGRRSRSPT